MQKPDTIEVETTDLGTWLESLASQIRLAGMSLEGYAKLHFLQGQKVYEDLHEISTRLDRQAFLLGAAADRLCPRCGLIGLSSRVVFGPQEVEVARRRGRQEVIPIRSRARKAPTHRNASVS